MRTIAILILLTLSACSASTPDDLCQIIYGKPCAEVTPKPTPTASPLPTVSPTSSPILTPIPRPSPTASPTKTIAPKPTVGSGNPNCSSGVLDARVHLLWKPKSDTSGNAVVVFDGKYKQEFQSVKAQYKDGKFEDLYWKPLILWGNPDKDGDRQHWRAKSPCGKFKDKALIIADDGSQVCKFQITGDACRRWE